MGLALLVVIVLIGGLFFMTRERDEPATTATDYEYALLAQSIVDIFLRTDVGEDCPGMTMDDLVRDALLIGSNPCGDSVALLESRARTVIENVTGTRYDFSIGVDGEEPAVWIEQCPKGRGTTLERRGEARIRLYPTTQTALVTAQFCPRTRL